ncbi:hypothetical protein [Gelidibacter gilvus]|uniref:Uncharacterized protein n=1 Tax=Gelidibacter gilvus TaxID=59602 RepID=A0A4Q0XKA4_9FLAO|nr:hypothetical protein [Gelidibacter gilvus]RXJ52669.1 hypothetical protein ESZ48_02965 [Gelidibacter gilvus]
MKALFPFIFTLLICSSCLDTQSQDARSASKSDLGLFTQSTQKHYFVDGKTGLVVFEKEYPAVWDILSRPNYNLDSDFPSFLYLMQNKKGMKAFNTPIHQFVAFQNPQYAQMMRSYGLTNERPLISPTDFIESEIRPMMERQGFKFLSHREFPEITAYIEQQKKRLGIQNMDFIAYSTEWVNGDNIKALVTFNQLILHYDPALTGGEDMKIWNYQMGYFFAPASNYEADMKIAINADFKKIDSPNWQKYQMQVNNFRQQQQTLEHENRMRNQQIQFDQHQKMMNDRYAANDANHARFMDNLRGTNTASGYSSNSSHSNFIDMIREEQNVSLNGKTFKVNAGADNYWMNSDGKYIATNSQFYDPNRDPVYDRQQWDLTTKN